MGGRGGGVKSQRGISQTPPGTKLWATNERADLQDAFESLPREEFPHSSTRPRCTRTACIPGPRAYPRRPWNWLRTGVLAVVSAPSYGNLEIRLIKPHIHAEFKKLRARSNHRRGDPRPTTQERCLINVSSTFFKGGFKAKILCRRFLTEGNPPINAKFIKFNARSKIRGRQGAPHQ